MNTSGKSKPSTQHRGLTINLAALVVACFALIGGCSNPPPPETEEASNTVQLDDIKLLIVGDDKIGPVIKRQWAARRDATLTFEDCSREDFESGGYVLDDAIDVVIFPPSMIGELAAQKQIAEIPKSVWSDTELLNNKEMLRHAKRTNVRLGRSTWAVPLGSPQLVMFYRQDVLDALGSKVPTTWEEFDRLIEKLKATQTLSDDSGNDLPTTAAFPLKDDWAVTTYLARVAASVRSRGKLSILFDRNTMEPLIETTPFVEALNQLKAYNEGESPDRWQSPGDVYREMVEGRLAVAITWPSAHFTRNEDGSGFDESKVIDAIKIARLPGSIRYFDGSDKGWTERDRADSHHVDLVGFEGFVASFNQKSGHSLTAHEFLKWLPSKSISLTTMTESKHSGPFRASHLGNPFRWTGGAISPDTAQQYSDVIRQVNSDQSVVFLFPHITGHALYLDALNNAVQQCLSGETDASGALKQAAAKWREITEQLDVGQQRANLRKAQGI